MAGRLEERTVVRVRRMCGLVAVALVSTLLFTAQPQAAAQDPSPSASMDALVPGDPILDEWSATRRTYETEDPGVFISEVYAGPVNYLDEGVWTEIDTTLVPGGELGLEVAAGPADIEMADDSASEVIVSVGLDDGTGAGFGVEGASSDEPSVDDNVAVYEEVDTGADLQLEALPGGVKETIILEDQASSRTFIFPLQLEGLTATLQDGQVNLIDGQNEVRMVIPPGFMEDSASTPAYSEGVTYELADGGTTLVVSLDEAWLEDPARVYPVLVDPTLTIYSGTDDTYVNAGSSANNSSATVLKVGKATYANRSFLHFTSSGLDDMNIHQATLNLWQFDSQSCSATPVDVYVVIDSWQGSTTTTWPGPDVDPTAPLATIESGLGYSGACPEGVVSADLTRWVDEWSTSVNENYGISLRARDETTTTQFKQFYSAQTYLPPNLSVVWSDPTLTSAPSDPTAISPEGVQTGAPTLSATYSDPEGNAGRIAFLAYDAGTGAHVATYQTAQVSSGSSASVVATSFPIDQEIEYRAVAIDLVNGRYSRFADPVYLVRPSVWISSPSSLTEVDGTTDFAASLASGVTATSVNFLVDGVLEASDSTSPYTAPDLFNGATSGEYTVEVSLSGGTNPGAVSPPIGVTFDLAGGPDLEEDPAPQESEPGEWRQQRRCEPGELCLFRNQYFNRNAQEHLRQFCRRPAPDRSTTCGQFHQATLADNYWYDEDDGARLSADLANDIESLNNRLGTGGHVCFWQDGSYSGLSFRVLPHTNNKRGTLSSNFRNDINSYALAIEASQTGSCQYLT